MILVSLFLGMVAFIEVAFFIYLKRQVSKLAGIKILTHLRNSESETLFQEAELTNQKAREMYDEATWLVVQSKAEGTPLLPH